MKRNIQGLSGVEFDMVVVGAGIYGACVAWEAASRGLSVALLEKSDFGAATSSNSYKIAHGGMRYLQHGDVARVRASCHERSSLYRIAPHLVRPVPILVPAYGRGRRGKGVLWAGLTLYDALTMGRNRGIRDPQWKTRRSSILSRNEALREFPHLTPERLTGGALFQDGQMYSPARLVLAFLSSAAAAGARVANYAPVTGFIRDGGRILGVEATDALSGLSFSVRGKVVVNTAGPWAGALLKEGLSLRLGAREPSFSRDVGLVVRPQLHPKVGLACTTSTKDAEATLDRGGRHLFLLPWRNHTLVGVWHQAYRGSPDEITVSDHELEGFVAEANEAYPGLQLRVRDVGLVITGLILFGDPDQDGGRHKFGRRSLVLDHAREDGLEGLVTVVGVRATTARRVAQRVVDRAAKGLGRPVSPSRSDRMPLAGGNFDTFAGLVSQVQEALPQSSVDVCESLSHNYGSDFSAVASICKDSPELGEVLPGSAVLKAEVLHAVREEMAWTLEDVVLRRTDLGTAGHPGGPALSATSQLMKEELAWGDERLRSETEAMERFYSRRAAQRAFSLPPTWPLATESTSMPAGSGG